MKEYCEICGKESDTLEDGLCRKCEQDMWRGKVLKVQKKPLPEEKRLRKLQKEIYNG